MGTDGQSVGVNFRLSLAFFCTFSENFRAHSFLCFVFCLFLRTGFAPISQGCIITQIVEFSKELVHLAELEIMPRNSLFYCIVSLQQKQNE